ncbi:MULTISPECIES: RrF2 family transcriptional regulator [unclassified Saccharicrinis]|uniref:RrF2 family transcriptional regulator n=1 Tax=unclassified Saccharicrinis TaxID=2646859 RepID=UPI003D32559A
MLSKSTEYAIRALVYVQLCNWEQQRPGVGEIAKEIEAPESYTAKILQTLTKNKLMDSMKGRGGGFFFNNNQCDLTLYDVIHVIEGDACFHKCGFGLRNCNNDNPCPLHEQYKVVRDGFFAIVQTETIKSLSQKIKQGEAVLNRLSG